jgi:hypothetical protein
MGDHEAMVVTHTTDVGGDRAGVRWSELRNPNTTPELFQTGTFAPEDGLHRWMPAIAMDGQGNIAVGYSVANAETFPGLRYAARLASDPPGELSQGEAVVVNGSSVQSGGFNRWGDYFSMSVDEADDCTFWFTGEYASDTLPNNWSTRIAAITMPLCTATEVGTITGRVLRGNGSALPGAMVSVGPFSAVTGADGTYSLLVEAGTYDVTASAFGFGSQTQTGVTVADGDTVTVDFRLRAAPRVRVTGTVSDDASGGYGLYAEVTFTPVGAPAVKVFTDPATGHYALRLPSGEEFEVTVHSIVPGYLDETRPLVAGPGDVIADFGLEVNTGTCNAPGYTEVVTPGPIDALEGAFPPDGWTLENATTGCAAPGLADWTNTDPGGRTNLTEASGLFAIADSDRCGGAVVMDAILTSPPIDLSGLTDVDGLQISFNQDLNVFTATGTLATVEVWDGVQWQVVSAQQSNSRGRVTFGTKLANGVADARVRFRYQAGFEWWWQIDDIQLSTATCDFADGGGLVFGTITDRNTGLGINGATVTATGEEPVTTIATPEDNHLKDGLYFTFLAAPGQITASADGYQTRTVNLSPVPGGVARRDIGLGAGIVSAQPAELSLRVPYRGTATTTLTLVNTGTAPATVDLSELEGPVSTVTIGPFDPAGRRAGARSLAATDARSVLPHDFPRGRPLAAGDSVRRFPTGLTLPWGVGYNSGTTSGWITNPALGGGDDLGHEFEDSGAGTGQTLDLTSIDDWAADMAYDPLNDKLWVMSVLGATSCIYEVDPVTRAPTGNTICPAFASSERGLAYDPVTDTFYAGGWNDGAIYQFDRSGTILRSISAGLSISGLAYNPSTGHLFVMVNDEAAVPDIFLFDTAGELTLIGQFEINDGGTPVFADFAGAGLELDCAGNLWAANQVTGEVVVAQSNEPPACDLDLPWIITDPESVTIPAGGSVAISVSVDASSLTPGLREAQLLLRTDTPYDVPPVPFHVTVAFNDVPEGSPGDAEIHGLAGADVSFGCGGGNFCPADDLTRVVFAVWGLRSAFGTEYVPPRATGLPFDDLSPKEFGADFAEEAAALGLIDGCGPRLYCPDDALTRREGAIYSLRLLFGADYVPPPATGLFGDVAPEDAPFVEDAVARGIFEACGAGAFCPDDGIDRANGAIFLVRAFGFNTLP